MYYTNYFGVATVAFLDLNFEWSKLNIKKFFGKKQIDYSKTFFIVSTKPLPFHLSIITPSHQIGMT